jgi:hypothetical protein
MILAPRNRVSFQSIGITGPIEMLMVMFITGKDGEERLSGDKVRSISGCAADDG